MQNTSFEWYLQNLNHGREHIDATGQFCLPMISAHLATIAFSHLPTFPFIKAIPALTPQVPVSVKPPLQHSKLKSFMDTWAHHLWIHPFLFLKSTYTFDLQHILSSRSNYAPYENALSQDESLELPSLKVAFPVWATFYSSLLAAKKQPPFAQFKWHSSLLQIQCDFF